MLLSLTSNFPKPRLALLTYSKKIRKSILKGDEILTLEEIINDLTADEVAFLRKDIDIDNLLIKKGLSFNTLKEDTKEQIKNNLSILKLYISMTPPKTSLIHLIYYKNESILLDNNKYII